METRLEAIERRIKTIKARVKALGWDYPGFLIAVKQLITAQKNLAYHIPTQSKLVTAAECLLAGYEAQGGEGPVVEINPPITCAFFIERERPDKPGDQLIGDCQLLEIDKCTHGEKPCPDAGRYRLVRVGDVEVGDAR